jgi:hypothetical protein
MTSGFPRRRTPAPTPAPPLADVHTSANVAPTRRRRADSGCLAESEVGASGRRPLIGLQGKIGTAREEGALRSTACGRRGTRTQRQPPGRNVFFPATSRRRGVRERRDAPPRAHVCTSGGCRDGSAGPPPARGGIAVLFAGLNSVISPRLSGLEREGRSRARRAARCGLIGLAGTDLHVYSGNGAGRGPRDRPHGMRGMAFAPARTERCQWPTDRRL